MGLRLRTLCGGIKGHSMTTETSQAPVSRGPLAGLLVIALEQAVAAPYCSSRLADAGARVIKIERPEGDFARGYDQAVHGESSYFVWVNRGKESIALDLKQPDDRAWLEGVLSKADVFLQNLAPGATERMGLGSARLRALHPRLITCDVSGYGEAGPQHTMKAYDLLVQAESGLVAVSGAPGEWGRIGVSLCDISAGMNALIGIQQALLARAQTGQGSAVKVSLFDSAAELMAVPFLQAKYGGTAPQRVGLKHPSIAPYGAFTCADGRDIVISIQNEREWVAFCAGVMLDATLASDARCLDNASRVRHREWLETKVSAVFAATQSAEMIDRLNVTQTAYGSVNAVADLINHPQLRTKRMLVNGAEVDVPATPWIAEWDAAVYPCAPAVNQQGEALRQEFVAAPTRSAHQAAAR
jgi:itaconate CoA-transferase